jgi:hypothetical protein
MLFLLVMDVLNHFRPWVEQHGFLTPFDGLPGSRVNLYADDLILSVMPDELDLLTIKTTLSIFGLASGLFSNLDKSVAAAIHYDEQDIK